MSVSHLNWHEALRVVRVGRKIANPNSGFQIQLQDFENNKLTEERRRMKERFPSLAIHDQDLDYIYRALEHFERMIATRDLCHFNCKRNENCPTGKLWILNEHLLHVVLLFYFCSLDFLAFGVLNACKLKAAIFEYPAERFNFGFFVSFIYRGKHYRKWKVCLFWDQS